ncbi:zinc-binding dehydrogenase [uncultured Nocardioides sp.]|uniref:zinc-binding dehydrogenase n=1 Tax=uncultured Nocardioides sp. TaxID=198441 RepID=UPI002635AA4F|nr:zinc-binding dehydrogenase [uncultured Nocardioides sp.]
MRALVVVSPGQPPVVDTRPEPTSGPGTTLVRLTAAPVVPLDLLCASGTSYFGAPATPYVPGVQGVGVVEASAAHLVGSRVFVSTTAGMAPGDGAHAERVVVPDGAVTPLPTSDAPDGSPDDATVAALGLSAVAAWACLVLRARLAAGEHVLVLGAGGAVGQAALGAARSLGAARVVAGCRPGTAADRARAAGADVVVDTTGPVGEVAARLAEACGGRLDVVVDPVWGAPAEAALAAISPGGRLVNLGSAAGETATLGSALLRSRSAVVLGHTNNALSASERDEGLRAMLDLAGRGEVRVAHEVVPLAEGPRAWAAVGDGTAGSRVVLAP